MSCIYSKQQPYQKIFRCESIFKNGQNIVKLNLDSEPIDQPNNFYVCVAKVILDRGQNQPAARFRLICDQIQSFQLGPVCILNHYNNYQYDSKNLNISQQMITHDLTFRLDQWQDDIWQIINQVEQHFYVEIVIFNQFFREVNKKQAYWLQQNQQLHTNKQCSKVAVLKAFGYDKNIMFTRPYTYSVLTLIKLGLAETPDETVEFHEYLYDSLIFQTYQDLPIDNAIFDDLWQYVHRQSDIVGWDMFTLTEDNIIQCKEGYGFTLDLPEENVLTNYITIKADSIFYDVKYQSHGRFYIECNGKDICAINQDSNLFLQEINNDYFVWNPITHTDTLQFKLYFLKEEYTLDEQGKYVFSQWIKTYTNDIKIDYQLIFI